MKVLKFDLKIFERRALAEVVEALNWFESTGSRSKFKDWDNKYGKIIQDMKDREVDSGDIFGYNIIGPNSYLYLYGKIIHNSVDEKNDVKNEKRIEDEQID